MLVVDADHSLDVLVIGRHTSSDQPERRGKTVEEIDLHGVLFLLEEGSDGVEA